MQTNILNRHGLSLSVLVEVPEQSKGLVFILHGLMSFKERADMTMLAQASLAKNLTAVRFDMSHGVGASEGNFEQITQTTFNDDLADVIEWAKKHEWYQEPFILVGHSMGGLTVLEYTHAHPDKVKAVAPLSAVISGQLSVDHYHLTQPEALTHWQDMGWFEQQSISKPGLTVRLPWSYMEDRLQYDALAYAGDITVPVLICVGDMDDTCPAAHQMLLQDALGSVDKELHIIKDIAHSFRTPDELAALETHFRTWLKKIA